MSNVNIGLQRNRKTRSAIRASKQGFRWWGSGNGLLIGKARVGTWEAVDMTSTHKPPLLGGAALRAVPAGAFSMKPTDNLTIRIEGKRRYKVEGASLIGTRLF